MTTIVYTGLGQLGDWSDPKNWNIDKAPTLKDDVQILSGASIPFSGTVTANAIMIIDGGTDSFAGSVTTVGAGVCNGFMVCVGSTVVFVPGSLLNDGGIFQIGVGGVGAFVADGTSSEATTIHTDTGAIGEMTTGVGTVTINDATWTTTAYLLVGSMGTGTLNVVNGGHVIVGSTFALGYKPGGSGTVTLSSGSVVTVDGSTIIGADPATGIQKGTVTINSGSALDVQSWLTVNDGSAIHLAAGTIFGGETNGGVSVEAGAQLTGYGTVQTASGNLIFDKGAIEAEGGTLNLDNTVTGDGTILIAADSTIALAGKSLLTSTLTFLGGSGETLSLHTGADVTSTITGFTFGDQIDMAGINKALWNATTQILTLSEGAKTVDTLHLAGSYSGDVFTVAQTGGVGVVMLHQN